MIKKEEPILVGTEIEDVIYLLQRNRLEEAKIVLDNFLISKKAFEEHIAKNPPRGLHDIG